MNDPRPGIKVSVVTTVYNGERFFDQSPPSILAQSLTDFEWIILDDGSSDATPRLLAELAARDPRVRVLSPGRLGRAQALNRAVGEARGEYIAIQDFDDVSYPERLLQQSRFLEAHPRVGVVGAHYVLIDENRAERYVRQPPTDHAGLRRAMARSIPFAHTMVMFRRAAWLQAGGYPVQDDIEDLALWIGMARGGWELANLPEVLGEHYVYAASYWHRNFSYMKRQRSLARVQVQAIRQLRLPASSYVYPLGRLVYGYLPTGAKRTVRRLLGRSSEQDT
ncbi:glycosyltransferase family 2 protein [Deinococcus koreensis]|uniref:Glycosyltransferase 2-like domain-containing protein n=1 Tax=Deinococcus koreensis TaxID=2054903 RepID=A0A2K3UZB9_9DEIO|nr:glycosyltransferase [Deinococcus koreensis]PNY81865.1 hypothetical protein CVO96_11200 [Deinococcus koreensis]